MNWTEQQLAIFDWFEGKGTKGNLVVVARAGASKTSCIVEGVKRCNDRSVLLAAFNKRIQEELAARILTNPRAKAQTLHSVGFAAVRRALPSVKLDKLNLREADLTNRAIGEWTPDYIKNLVGKLHTKAREMMPDAENWKDLEEIAYRFELEPDDVWANSGWDMRKICMGALKAMEIAAISDYDTGIDFADMIFMPVRNRWTTPTFDLIVVDEAQDMTKAQLDVALGSLRKGGRVCIVGDDRQAIYGFRGADSGSIGRLKSELRADTLYLTTTFRCARKIVEEAQTLVPDLQPWEHAPEGIVAAINEEHLVGAAENGDFILSRTNAPLVPTALGLLLSGKRCKIAGRDIGAGLKKIVRRIVTPGMSLEGFVDACKGWADREILRLKAKGRPDAALDIVRDKQDMLVAMTDGVDSVEAVVTRIDALFSDSGLGAAGTITLSSVHRAKGLEANRVFVLNYTLYPRGENPEERNIHYVAVTRAKQELVMVTR